MDTNEHLFGGGAPAVERDIEEEKADIRSGGGTMVAEKIDPLPTDTKYQAAKFIETYTGRKFYPLFPERSAISVIDIAHALSQQCRYTGHVRDFYSVAQHSCLLADHAERKLKAPPIECLQILMHDAPEGYLVDIARPVKQYMPEYRKWDHGINDVIRQWLHVDHLPIPAYQDELDTRVIVDERAQLMSDSGNVWNHDKLDPLGIVIEPWMPRQAEHQFLIQYATYTSDVFGAPQYLREGWGASLHGTYSDGGAPMSDITDLIEVDLLGGVGRVKVRSENGMLIRDPRAGRYPRPAWKWLHGDFVIKGVNDGARPAR